MDSTSGAITSATPKFVALSPVRVHLRVMETFFFTMTKMPNTMRINMDQVLSDLDSQPFYHGTKAGLKPGDLIQPGYNSNYGTRKKAAYVYLTATLEAATWGAELAQGE